jgi:predicted glycogen debranching enzyme
MPGLETAADGFVFEGAYQVRGPGFEPAGEWFQGVFHREEAARGLAPSEDLFHAGTFGAELAPGQELAVVCWAGGGDAPPAAQVLEDARTRARAVVTAAGASDDVERALALAADQFVVDGPDVMAGYPWFERWARDTMTSYEGLFLETGRLDEGRALLLRAGGELSDGLLLNNTGGEHNTVDGSLWFVHAAGRHVERTGDDDLAAALVPALDDVIAHYAAGTDFGIRADNDGLLRAGADGYALTWMDARVDGRPITSRAGKPVEINALWVDALTTVAALRERLGREPGDVATLADRARTAFAGRFVRGGGLLDVAGPDDPAVRPNQLLAASLPHAPLADPVAVHACAPLLTTLGLRSLAPSDPAYRGRHRGDGASRDAAYHQGTVWPWLVGPYVEAALKTGVPVDGVLDGLVAHLADFGIGSVSETADGDAPHAATGCPFQAWSVAELLRARRLVLSSG